MKKHLMRIAEKLYKKDKGLDIKKLSKEDQLLYLSCIAKFITDKKELFVMCSKVEGMTPEDDLSEVSNEQMVEAIVDLMKDGEYHVIPDNEDNFVVLYFNHDEMTIMHQVENGVIIV